MATNSRNMVVTAVQSLKHSTIVYGRLRSSIEPPTQPERHSHHHHPESAFRLAPSNSQSRRAVKRCEVRMQQQPSCQSDRGSACEALVGVRRRSNRGPFVPSLRTSSRSALRSLFETEEPNATGRTWDERATYLFGVLVPVILKCGNACEKARQVNIRGLCTRVVALRRTFDLNMPVRCGRNLQEAALPRGSHARMQSHKL